MKTRYILGLLIIAIGGFWILPFVHFLNSQFFDIQVPDPSIWSEQVYLPASAVSFLFYLGYLLTWVYCTYHQRYKSSNEAKQARGQWLALLFMSVLTNIIILILYFAFTQVVWPPSIKNSMGANFIYRPPYEIMIPLTLVNGFLLYWIPSCFLSQRTLRFIPPFSYELNNITEKR